MGLDFPLGIPSVILCAKVPFVLPLWCFPCFRRRVQLGEVPWPYLTCPITTAVAWSPASILVQWSGGYRSEDNDADDVFWNPLLRRCEWVCAWACAFARLPLHSSPLLGGLKSRGLLAPASWWTGSCHCGANDGSCFDVNSNVFFEENCPVGFLPVCTDVVKWQCICTYSRNTSNLNPAHPLLKPYAMQVWNPVWSLNSCHKNVVQPRNFLSDSIDLIPGWNTEAPESAANQPTASTCIMQASRTGWALRLFRCRLCFFRSLHNMCLRLMPELYTLGHRNDVEGYLRVRWLS